MKTLTIKQPWASLITQGIKKYEFRSWKTNYRGSILIHAGKGIDKKAIERLKDYIPKELPLGMIIGQADITDCIEVTKEFKEKLMSQNPDIYRGPSIGEYAWKLDNLVVFDKSIPATGKLSLWDYNL